MPLSLRYAARSDVGLVRSGNEDSGYAGDQFAPLGEFCGGADFLAKPYSPPKLLRAMNRALGLVAQSDAPTR